MKQTVVIYNHSKGTKTKGEIQNEKGDSRKKKQHGQYRRL